jgi:hypothetical protein
VGLIVRIECDRYRIARWRWKQGDIHDRPPHTAKAHVDAEGADRGQLAAIEALAEEALDDRFHETNQLKLPGPHPEEPGDA